MERPALQSAEGIFFQTLPFEVLGGVHESAINVLKKIGQTLARSSGQEEAVVTRHLFGRLSVLLMQGNAQLILSRIPKHPEAHINGIM